jgi:hypothetical protein
METLRGGGMAAELVRAFGPTPDPDAEGYDPFAQCGRFEPKP